VAIVHFYGEASAIEAIRATQEWQADERFDQLHHVIYDLRMAQSIETLDNGAVENIATMSIGASFSNPQIEIAVVLPDNSLKPFIERVVALIATVYLGDVYPIRIFSAIAGADQWARPRR
jgi:hypothetical protein